MPHFLFNAKPSIELHFIAWIAYRFVPLPFMASSIWSFFCRLATCFPTWPKVCLFHNFNDVWHSSRQASNGHCEWLICPFSHASFTTFLHLSSTSHLDSNRNNLECRHCCLGRLVSLSTKILWPETELDKWYSFNNRNTVAQSVDSNLYLVFLAPILDSLIFYSKCNLSPHNPSLSIYICWLPHKSTSSTLPTLPHHQLFPWHVLFHCSPPCIPTTSYFGNWDSLIMSTIPLISLSLGGHKI